MGAELDRRTYDILRLVERHGPIGSIQLVELMQLRGYDIKDRTIRLKLSELDDAGLTEKVPGKGRRLTRAGREELEQGDVRGRLEQVRAEIATLTSRVSYDPVEDAGVIVASGAFIDEDDVEAAVSLIERLEALPLGPVPVSLEESSETEPGDYRLLAPSSITLDGVLLSHGVNANLLTAGVLEYEPTASSAETADESVDGSTEYVALPGSESRGGRIVRYVDVINGEGSSIDVISLLVEAGRSNVRPLLEDGDSGLLIGDDREFPINRFEEARDLTIATRDALGGVFDFRRPREDETVSNGTLAWAFGTLTYCGTGELALAALHEYGLTEDWETLYGTIERNRLGPIAAPRPAALDD
jgi:repressor of nif and glnA expression